MQMKRVCSKLIHGVNAHRGSVTTSTPATLVDLRLFTGQFTCLRQLPIVRADALQLSPLQLHSSAALLALLNKPLPQLFIPLPSPAADCQPAPIS